MFNARYAQIQKAKFPLFRSQTAPLFGPKRCPVRDLRCAALPLRSLSYNQQMANLTLVYGLRLLPSDEVAEVGDATIKLKNGREAHVTMHVLEGGKDEIEKQLKTSLSAFFDFYPEI
jgi:hypothetical protein